MEFDERNHQSVGKGDRKVSVGEAKYSLEYLSKEREKHIIKPACGTNLLSTKRRFVETLKNVSLQKVPS